VKNVKSKCRKSDTKSLSALKRHGGCEVVCAHDHKVLSSNPTRITSWQKKNVQDENGLKAPIIQPASAKFLKTLFFNYFTVGRKDRCLGRTSSCLSR